MVTRAKTSTPATLDKATKPLWTALDPENYKGPNFDKEPLKGLGLLVRDEVTGYTGMVTQVSVLLSGNVQFAVQPSSTDCGVTMPDAMQLDVHSLKAVGDGLSKTVIKVPNPTTIPLGVEVEDIITGIKAITTQKTTFMNGCEVFLLEVALKNRQPLTEFAHHINAIRLKVTGKNDKTKQLNLPPADDRGRPPGGPSKRLTHTPTTRLR
jgi:hypothetical protein